MLSLMRAFDKEPKDDGLNFFEFEDYHKAKPPGPHKCTLRQEEDTDNLNINKCSSMADCYSFDAGRYDNSMCHERESCGKFRYYEQGRNGKSNYHVKEGRCVDPSTSAAVDSDKITIDSSAADVSYCRGACDKNEDCKAYNFIDNTCSLITGASPTEGVGDGSNESKCHIKNQVTVAGCILSDFCQDNEHNRRRTYLD